MIQNDFSIPESFQVFDHRVGNISARQVRNTPWQMTLTLYEDQHAIRRHTTGNECKPQYTFLAFNSRSADHGSVWTNENHTVIFSQAKAGDN